MRHDGEGREETAAEKELKKIYEVHPTMPQQKNKSRYKKQLGRGGAGLKAKVNDRPVGGAGRWGHVPWLVSTRIECDILCLLGTCIEGGVQRVVDQINTKTHTIQVRL